MELKWNCVFLKSLMSCGIVMLILRKSKGNVLCLFVLCVVAHWEAIDLNCTVAHCHPQRSFLDGRWMKNYHRYSCLNAVQYIISPFHLSCILQKTTILCLLKRPFKTIKILYQIHFIFLLFGFVWSVVFPVSLDRHGIDIIEKDVCRSLSILTWLGSLYCDWAACDKGREKFNHELILQSVQKVDISDPWAVPREDVGNLQMYTQHTSVTALCTTLFLNDLCDAL